MATTDPSQPGRSTTAHRFSGVFEASPNPVVAVDRLGRITYVNPRAEAAFGYVGDELLGQPVEVLVPDQNSKHHTGLRDRFLAHPQPRPMGIGLDLSGRRKDGTEFPAEISLSPVDTSDGAEFIATIVDISLRKASESSLAASESRFRAVFQASPNPIVAVDNDARITYVNPQAETTFGYSRSEVLGLPVEVLLPQRVGIRHVAHRDGFLAHPVARPMGIGLDLAGRRKDGTEFPVEISLSPVEISDRVEVFATVVDLTARKVTESQLLQAQKLESIGRLAGGIAHDFNNMLFAIRGFAEMLEEDLSPEKRSGLNPAEALRSVNAISNAAERASVLTGQLLAFGRQQILSPAVLDVNEAIESVEPMLRRLIGENIRLSLELAADLAHVRADSGQLGQVLVNLVVNARDAMPSGGTVAIQTANAVFDEPYSIEHYDVAPGSYAMIAVSDTGIGMDRATKEHVFEPFFTTKDPGKGTGLGLATIYGIVRQAGGHIWLYSEPGHGTSFKLYLPAVDAPVSETPRLVEPPMVGAEGAVLVVEDEPAVREMTAMIIQRAGYNVVALSSGRDEHRIPRRLVDRSRCPRDGRRHAGHVRHRPGGGPDGNATGHRRRPPIGLSRRDARSRALGCQGGRVRLEARDVSGNPRSRQPCLVTRACEEESRRMTRDPGESATTVLVVDDEDGIRQMLALALGRAGFTVVEAATGEAALNLIKAGGIAVVILDVALGDTTGTRVVEVLRGQPDTETLPMILITGSGDDQSVIEGLRAGADDFLTKPVRLDELVARVRAHLRSTLAWSEAVGEELRARQSVIAALGAIAIAPEPEETAARIVSELARGTNSDFVAVLQVVQADRLVELATYNPVAGVVQGGASLPSDVARELIAHAVNGPWLERLPQTENEPSTEAFAMSNLAVLAGAPIHAAGELVAVLTIGLSFGNPRLAQATHLLAAAVDFAGVLSAVAGNAIVDRRNATATRIRLLRLVTNREFHPVFQPIVELESRRVVGFEALTRFDDGTPPDVMFLAAERSGLAAEFELGAIRAAIDASSKLPAAAFLALNISPAVLLANLTRVRQLLQRAPHRVVLEMTEHEPIADYDALRAALARLGEVTISVDDAGAGYASMRHI
ncbi:MAG: PAS domain S-box protein, partial [Candidatus Limnocylindrales bacterium]